MKIFAKKKSAVSPLKPRSSARPKIHNAVVEKKANQKTKENTEKRTQASFTKAMTAFFSRKKKPHPPLKASKKMLETKIPKEIPANVSEKQIEVKIRTSRSRLRFILPLALPIGALALMPWVLPHAAAIKLYPTTCLGGWENPKNAEGVPDLPIKSSPDHFNDRNSAVLRNSLAQIFCADFTNTFPPDAFPKKMYLRFSWTTIAPPAGAHVLEIPKVSAETPSALPAEPVAATEASSTASSTISVTSTSGKKTVTDSKPVSFFEKLLNVAFAESASGTPTLASTTSVQQQDGYVSAPLPPKEESVLLEEKPKLEGADFLQVLYTLDGQNWKQLGMVTRENLADLSFQVPISDDETLSRFQVSIQNVISLDNPPVIYLDGMWLEAGESK